ncbi:FAD-binding oxidoreductase [Cellulomonas sp. KRMCY2]|uniref:FAD-binding oxidoreductase n=1 Tax=Cellulomonas sp. KRMCY2 TaxID=1304865 RepID=UPI00045EBEE4|nr:FAD-binding oxidoreductase [Cellulomonas sp. KRMCY2]
MPFDTARPTLDVAGLRQLVTGPVLTPGDPGYDAARLVRYGDPDRRPAAVVQAQDTQDVRHAVAAARGAGLELAVRSGGHSAVGHGTTDGGLVVDLRGLTELSIDPGDRTAWVGAGVTAGAFTLAAGEHGLATGFGDTGSVGITGIVLGGGVGLLSRRHGLTIDSLLAAEVVTASGDLVLADADSDADLFWALRGGGGNLGVVTRLKLRLHDVRDFVGGILVLPATPDVLEGFVDLAGRAPRELTTIVNVMLCPPMPFVPAEAHGRPVVLAMIAWAGDVDEGQRVIGELRALAEPLADLVGPSPYAAMFADEGHGADGPAPTAVSQTMFVDSIDAATAEQAVSWVAGSSGPSRVVQVRVLGGAVGDVPSDATAYAHRDAPIMVNVATLYGAAAQREPAWLEITRMRGVLDQGRPGVYVNFLGDEGPDRVREAYPGRTWDRLVEIKRRYDPENVFRLNQNIPPT